MLADLSGGWALGVAAVAAVPATFAAYGAYKNSVRLRTSDGHTVGELVETLTEKVHAIETEQIPQLGIKVDAARGDIEDLKDTGLQNRTAILWLQREFGRTNPGGEAVEE